MSEQEQVEALSDDLDRLIQRYCDEFELTTASAVGVLAFKMHMLMAYAVKRSEDEE